MYRVPKSSSSCSHMLVDRANRLGRRSLRARVDDGRVVVKEAEDVKEGGAQFSRHDAAMGALGSILTVRQHEELRD